MSHIKVAVRVRPLSARELDAGTKSVVEVSGQKVSVWNPKLDTADPEAADSRHRVKCYSFDYVYGPVQQTSATPTSSTSTETVEDADEVERQSQEAVFGDLGAGVLEAAFDGYNACVFAYGQTGSGKTYTMMGGPASSSTAGLTPRICQALFERVENKIEDNLTCRVEVSYVEIYNERVRDLLRPALSGEKYSLRVREHPKDGPYVEDLSKHLVKSYDAVRTLLEKGAERRVTAATHYHDESSRSHAIFTISFTQAKLDENLPSEIVSKIHLVDLAGSERANTNGGTSEQDKSRLKEGANINRSLVTLGNVIKALAEHGNDDDEDAADAGLTAAAAPAATSRSLAGSPCFQNLGGSVGSDRLDRSANFSSAAGGSPFSPRQQQHREGLLSGAGGAPASKRPRGRFVPYRDSSLTWLLKDSLGGNSKTMMIANISPSSCYYRETMSTLRYASRAKTIINQPTINEDYHVRLIRELRTEIERLRLLVCASHVMPSDSVGTTSAALVEKIEQDEMMAQSLLADWMDKWTEARDIMKESDMSIRRGGPRRCNSMSVIVDSEVPHLVGMDADILNTGVIIYNIKTGSTTVGREDPSSSLSSATMPDIALDGPGIESEHCVIEHSATDGGVYLHPGCHGSCKVNGREITDTQRLSQGDVILFGESRMFRFNHPSEAAELRRKRLDAADLSNQLRRHHSNFELFYRGAPQLLSRSSSASSMFTSGIDCESPSPTLRSARQNRAISEAIGEIVGPSPEDDGPARFTEPDLVEREALEDMRRQLETERAEHERAEQRHLAKEEELRRRSEERTAAVARQERHLAALIASNEALKATASREISAARQRLELEKLKHVRQVREDLQKIIELREQYHQSAATSGNLQLISPVLVRPPPSEEHGVQTELPRSDVCQATQTDDASATEGMDAMMSWQGHLKAATQKELLLRIMEFKQRSSLRLMEADFEHQLQLAQNTIGQAQEQLARLEESCDAAVSVDEASPSVEPALAGHQRGHQEVRAGHSDLSTSAGAQLPDGSLSSAYAVAEEPNSHDDQLQIAGSSGGVADKFHLAASAAEVTSRLYPQFDVKFTYNRLDQKAPSSPSSSRRLRSSSLSRGAAAASSSIAEESEPAVPAGGDHETELSVPGADCLDGAPTVVGRGRQRARRPRRRVTVTGLEKYAASSIGSGSSSTGRGAEDSTAERKTIAASPGSRSLELLLTRVVSAESKEMKAAVAAHSASPAPKRATRLSEHRLSRTVTPESRTGELQSTDTTETSAASGNAPEAAALPRQLLASEAKDAEANGDTIATAERRVSSLMRETESHRRKMRQRVAGRSRGRSLPTELRTNVKADGGMVFGIGSGKASVAVTSKPEPTAAGLSGEAKRAHNAAVVAAVTKRLTEVTSAEVALPASQQSKATMPVASRSRSVPARRRIEKVPEVPCLDRNVTTADAGCRLAATRSYSVPPQQTRRSGQACSSDSSPKTRIAVSPESKSLKSSSRRLTRQNRRARNSPIAVSPAEERPIGIAVDKPYDRRTAAAAPGEGGRHVEPRISRRRSRAERSREVPVQIFVSQGCGFGGGGGSKGGGDRALASELKPEGGSSGSDIRVASPRRDDGFSERPPLTDATHEIFIKSLRRPPVLPSDVSASLFSPAAAAAGIADAHDSRDSRLITMSVPAQQPSSQLTERVVPGFSATGASKPLSPPSSGMQTANDLLQQPGSSLCGTFEYSGQEQSIRPRTVDSCTDYTCVLESEQTHGQQKGECLVVKGSPLTRSSDGSRQKSSAAVAPSSPAAAMTGDADLQHNETDHSLVSQQLVNEAVQANREALIRAQQRLTMLSDAAQTLVKRRSIANQQLQVKRLTKQQRDRRLAAWLRTPDSDDCQGFSDDSLSEDPPMGTRSQPVKKTLPSKLATSTNSVAEIVSTAEAQSESMSEGQAEAGYSANSEEWQLPAVSPRSRPLEARKNPTGVASTAFNVAWDDAENRPEVLVTSDDLHSISYNHASSCSCSCDSLSAGGPILKGIEDDEEYRDASTSPLAITDEQLLADGAKATIEALYRSGRIDLQPVVSHSAECGAQTDNIDVDQVTATMLGTLPVSEPQNFPCVMATPERASVEGQPPLVSRGSSPIVQNDGPGTASRVLTNESFSGIGNVRPLRFDTETTYGSQRKELSLAPVETWCIVEKGDAEQAIPGESSNAGEAIREMPRAHRVGRAVALRNSNSLLSPSLSSDTVDLLAEAPYGMLLFSDEDDDHAFSMTSTTTPTSDRRSAPATPAPSESGTNSSLPIDREQQAETESAALAETVSVSLQHYSVKQASICTQTDSVTEEMPCPELENGSERASSRFSGDALIFSKECIRESAGETRKEPDEDNFGGKNQFECKEILDDDLTPLSMEFSKYYDDASDDSKRTEKTPVSKQDMGELLSKTCTILEEQKLQSIQGVRRMAAIGFSTVFVSQSESQPPSSSSSEVCSRTSSNFDESEAEKQEDEEADMKKAENDGEEKENEKQQQERQPEETDSLTFSRLGASSCDHTTAAVPIPLAGSISLLSEHHASRNSVAEESDSEAPSSYSPHSESCNHQSGDNSDEEGRQGCDSKPTGSGCGRSFGDMSADCEEAEPQIVSASPNKASNNQSKLSPPFSDDDKAEESVTLETHYERYPPSKHVGSSSSGSSTSQASESDEDVILDSIAPKDEDNGLYRYDSNIKREDASDSADDSEEQRVGEEKKILNDKDALIDKEVLQSFDAIHFRLATLDRDSHLASASEDACDPVEQEAAVSYLEEDRQSAAERRSSVKSTEDTAKISKADGAHLDVTCQSVSDGTDSKNFTVVRDSEAVGGEQNDGTVELIFLCTTSTGSEVLRLDVNRAPACGLDTDQHLSLCCNLNRIPCGSSLEESACLKCASLGEVSHTSGATEASSPDETILHDMEPSEQRPLRSTISMMQPSVTICCQNDETSKTVNDETLSSLEVSDCNKLPAAAGAQAQTKTEFGQLISSNSSESVRCSLDEVAVKRLEAITVYISEMMDITKCEVTDLLSGKAVQRRTRNDCADFDEAEAVAGDEVAITSEKPEGVSFGGDSAVSDSSVDRVDPLATSNPPTTTHLDRDVTALSTTSESATSAHADTSTSSKVKKRGLMTSKQLKENRHAGGNGALSEVSPDNFSRVNTVSDKVNAGKTITALAHTDGKDLLPGGSTHESAALLMNSSEGQSQAPQAGDAEVVCQLNSSFASASSNQLLPSLSQTRISSGINPTYAASADFTKLPLEVERTTRIVIEIDAPSRSEADKNLVTSLNLEAEIPDGCTPVEGRCNDERIAGSQSLVKCSEIEHNLDQTEILEAHWQTPMPNPPSFDSLTSNSADTVSTSLFAAEPPAPDPPAAKAVVAAAAAAGVTDTFSLASSAATPPNAVRAFNVSNNGTLSPLTVRLPDELDAASSSDVSPRALSESPRASHLSDDSLVYVFMGSSQNFDTIFGVPDLSERIKVDSPKTSSFESLAAEVSAGRVGSGTGGHADDAYRHGRRSSAPVLRTPAASSTSSIRPLQLESGAEKTFGTEVNEPTNATEETACLELFVSRDSSSCSSLDDVPPSPPTPPIMRPLLSKNSAQVTHIKRSANFEYTDVQGVACQEHAKQIEINANSIPFNEKAAATAASVANIEHALSHDVSLGERATADIFVEKKAELAECETVGNYKVSSNLPAANDTAQAEQQDATEAVSTMPSPTSLCNVTYSSQDGEDSPIEVSTVCVAGIETANAGGKVLNEAVALADTAISTTYAEGREAVSCPVNECHLLEPRETIEVAAANTMSYPATTSALLTSLSVGACEESEVEERLEHGSLAVPEPIDSRSLAEQTTSSLATDHLQSSPKSSTIDVRASRAVVCTDYVPLFSEEPLAPITVKTAQTAEHQEQFVQSALLNITDVFALPSPPPEKREVSTVIGLAAISKTDETGQQASEKTRSATQNSIGTSQSNAEFQEQSKPTDTRGTRQLSSTSRTAAKQPRPAKSGYEGTDSPVSHKALFRASTDANTSSGVCEAETFVKRAPVQKGSRLSPSPVTVVAGNSARSEIAHRDNGSLTVDAADFVTVKDDGVCRQPAGGSTPQQLQPISQEHVLKAVAKSPEHVAKLAAIGHCDTKAKISADSEASQPQKQQQQQLQQQQPQMQQKEQKQQLQKEQQEQQPPKQKKEQQEQQPQKQQKEQKHLLLRQEQLLQKEEQQKQKYRKQPQQQQRKKKSEEKEEENMQKQGQQGQQQQQQQQQHLQQTREQKHEQKHSENRNDRLPEGHPQVTSRHAAVDELNTPNEESMLDSADLADSVHLGNAKASVENCVPLFGQSYASWRESQKVSAVGGCKDTVIQIEAPAIVSSAEASLGAKIATAVKLSSELGSRSGHQSNRKYDVGSRRSVRVVQTVDVSGSCEDDSSNSCRGSGQPHGVSTTEANDILTNFTADCDSAAVRHLASDAFDVPNAGASATSQLDIIGAPVYLQTDSGPKENATVRQDGSLVCDSRETEIAATHKTECMCSKNRDHCTHRRSHGKRATEVRPNNTAQPSVSVQPAGPGHRLTFDMQTDTNDIEKSSSAESETTQRPERSHRSAAGSRPTALTGQQPEPVTLGRRLTFDMQTSTTTLETCYDIGAASGDPLLRLSLASLYRASPPAGAASIHCASPSQLSLAGPLAVSSKHEQPAGNELAEFEQGGRSCSRSGSSRCMSPSGSVASECHQGHSEQRLPAAGAKVPSDGDPGDGKASRKTRKRASRRNTEGRLLRILVEAMLNTKRRGLQRQPSAAAPASAVAASEAAGSSPREPTAERSDDSSNRWLCRGASSADAEGASPAERFIKSHSKSATGCSAEEFSPDNTADVAKTAESFASAAVAATASTRLQSPDHQAGGGSDSSQSEANATHRHFCEHQPARAGVVGRDRRRSGAIRRGIRSRGQRLLHVRRHGQVVNQPDTDSDVTDSVVANATDGAAQMTVSMSTAGCDSFIDSLGDSSVNVCENLASNASSPVSAVLSTESSQLTSQRHLANSFLDEESTAHNAPKCGECAVIDQSAAFDAASSCSQLAVSTEVTPSTGYPPPNATSSAHDVPITDSGSQIESHFAGLASRTSQQQDVVHVHRSLEDAADDIARRTDVHSWENPLTGESREDEAVAKATTDAFAAGGASLASSGDAGESYHRRASHASSVATSSSTRDEAIETESWADYELERLRSERERVSQLLARTVGSAATVGGGGELPMRLWQELAEAKLNYSLGQTDTLLQTFDSGLSAAAGSTGPQANNLWTSTRAEYLDQLRRLGAPETRTTYSQSAAGLNISELEQTRREIETQIRLLEMESERSRTERAKSRVRLMNARWRRQAEIEIFKLERERELQTSSLLLLGRHRRSSSSSTVSCRSSSDSAAISGSSWLQNNGGPASAGEAVAGVETRGSPRLRERSPRAPSLSAPAIPLNDTSSTQSTSLSSPSSLTPRSHMRHLAGIRRNLLTESTRIEGYKSTEQSPREVKIPSVLHGEAPSEADLAPASREPTNVSPSYPFTPVTASSVSAPALELSLSRRTEIRPTAAQNAGKENAATRTFDLPQHRERKLLPKLERVADNGLDRDDRSHGTQGNDSQLQFSESFPKTSAVFSLSSASSIVPQSRRTMSSRDAVSGDPTISWQYGREDRSRHEVAAVAGGSSPARRTAENPARGLRQHRQQVPEPASLVERQRIDPAGTLRTASIPARASAAASVTNRADPVIRTSEEIERDIDEKIESLRQSYASSSSSAADKQTDNSQRNSHRWSSDW